MEQWISLAKVYGPLGFFALALGAFLLFKVWPLITKRLEDADKERADHAQRSADQAKSFTDALKAEREDNARRFDEQGKIFMESMRVQNVLVAETHKEIMKTQNEITQELRILNNHSRNNRK